MKHNKKSRNKDKRSQPNKGGKYWIYGRHACVEAINNKERKISRILVTENIYNDIQGKINSEEPTYNVVSSDEISKILNEDAVHQGIAIEVSPLPEKSIEDIDDDVKVVVLLDQVTDPHNIGAIIRSSAAFGAGAVITTKSNSPAESGTMAKSSSGALEHIYYIRVGNLVQAIDALKERGFWCLGLDGGGETTIDRLPDYEKIAIIMGAEGKGMRRLTTEHADMIVSLPISNKVESLNVSNAAAIALYEIAKK